MNFMNNLTSKQKIIAGIVISAMVVIIGIYGYSMLQHEENWEQDALLSNEEIVNQNEIGAENTSSVKQNTNNGNEGEREGTGVETTGENQNIESDSTHINGYENLEGKIVIHITGAVQKPGILILTEGARIADAINAAGGNTEQADLNEVNLAYELQDGQKIYIPTKEDTAKLEEKAYITSGSGNNVIVQTIDTEGNSENGGNKQVNINTATQNDLESLPGIGESIASRIIEYREQNGKFEKIEDLQNVKGIGDAKFANIKEQIVVK